MLAFKDVVVAELVDGFDWWRSTELSLLKMAKQPAIASDRHWPPGSIPLMLLL